MNPFAGPPVDSPAVHKHRLVLTFGLLTGLFAAGYGVMFTVLDDFRNEYGIGDAALGGMISVGFFASFAAQVFFAPLADRGHARKLVYIGMVLNVAGLAGMAIGRDVLVLYLARLVMGVGAGVAVPAIRRIVILADPDHLGQNIGRLLAADVCGFALGPAVSAVLVSPLGIPAPFIVIAVATVACFPVIRQVQVDESVPADSETQARFAFDLLRDRAYVGALCFGAGVFVMIGTFDALWVLVLDDLKANDLIKNLGIVMFALPLAFLGSVGGRLAQRVGPFRVGTVGLVVGAAFMFLYGQLPTAVLMFAFSLVHAFSDGLTVSSSGVAVGLAAPPDRQAGAQGLLGGVQTLTGGVFSIVAGTLYEHSGRAAAYTTCAVFMVVLVGVGLVCARGEWSRRPEPNEIVAAENAAPDHLPLG